MKGRLVVLIGLFVVVFASFGACTPPPIAPPCEGPNCPVCTPGDRRKCYTGKPEELASHCRQGDQICEGEGQWGPCLDEVKPRPEICGDKLDNDCNGLPDDGCVCRPGETRDCGFRVGICKQGKQSCLSTGKWGDCVGQVKPKKELCDGKDDEDCDGIIDEDCTCIRGMERDCGSATGTCQPGKQMCDDAGVWGECKGEVGPSPETCDGKDNDCNGKVDDEIACP